MKVDSSVPQAIITPTVDAVCSGGLSLVIAVCVIVYSFVSNTDLDQTQFAISAYLATDLLINWPHFMASYRLLYSRPDNFRRHPLVTIAFPIVALGFMGFIIAGSSSSQNEAGAFQENSLITILSWAAPVFLGWHYTGQSWGMTACFTFLSGLRMTPDERRLIRSGFYALFAFHIAIVYHSMGIMERMWPEQEVGKYVMQMLLSMCRVAVFACFALGLLGFQRLSRREGKPIPVRVWLPWLATFSWYVMFDCHPASFFLLQVFHALQYLTFPIRVEMNQYALKNRWWLHMTVYYLALVVTGIFAFGSSSFIGGLSESQTEVVTASVIVLNLHHYFIDAVIWKIREPEVRKALFGHLDPAT